MGPPSWKSGLGPQARVAVEAVFAAHGDRKQGPEQRLPIREQRARRFDRGRGTFGAPMPRRLGQHTLRDPAILDRIVDALDPRPDDDVLEVGPGEGTLTRRLAPRVGRVVAIEKDRRLVDKLRGVRSGPLRCRTT